MPFLYGPILPHRSHFLVRLWWATGPTLSRYWLNFTPNYGVMMSRWIFWFLSELIVVKWNPFQRWFSEVAPVSWRINFISRTYGWGVKARFVIFGCSLVCLDYLMIILGHHYITVLLAKMLIQAPFSQSMCTFSFCINSWYCSEAVARRCSVKMCS